MSSTKLSRKVPPGASQQIEDHFGHLAWLRPTLDDESFIIMSDHREVTHDGAGHTLTGKTWNSDTTIKSLLSFYRPPPSSYPKDVMQLPLPMPEDTRAEYRRFYSLGQDLNAHPGLLHGGVICCLLDSCLGGAVEMLVSKLRGGDPMFTVQLNITYKKVVKSPCVIMLRAWVVKVEGDGRKVWAEGVVEGEGGVVHGKAEGMWLKGSKKRFGKL